MNRLTSIENYVKEKLKNDRSGHDWDHIQRVTKMAFELAEQIPHANKEIVIVASLVHELLDDKVLENIAEEKEALIKRLECLNFVENEIDTILFIIENVSYRANKAGIFSSLIEGAIVQDADRLDALGAVGIARAFSYGASVGNAMYSDDNLVDKKTTLGHFEDKLFKLEHLMNTEEARAIAVTRTKFMKYFVTQFLFEITNE